MTKLNTTFFLFIYLFVCSFIYFRFKLSLDAKNIVPVDDLIPELNCYEQRKEYELTFPPVFKQLPETQRQTDCEEPALLKKSRKMA